MAFVYLQLHLDSAPVALSSNASQVWWGTVRDVHVPTMLSSSTNASHYAEAYRILFSATLSDRTFPTEQVAYHPPVSGWYPLTFKAIVVTQDMLNTGKFPLGNLVVVD